MSKVSIVIPAYNQGRFLAQAIESALGQDHSDLEVVVIDDGSTDDTAEVAARYADRPNFRLVRQANTGLPGARNRGLAESTGDYVTFLDSDDYFAPDKVSRQAGLLDENPDTAFVYCDITTVDPDGQPVAEQYSVGQVNRVLSGDLLPSLLQGGYFPPHTVMVRRSALTQVGAFDPALGGHADYDLWLRLAAAGLKGTFQNDRLAFYRTHPGSMSRDGQHMAETRLATLRKLAHIHPEGVADGLDRLQQAATDLHRANQWLSENYQRLSTENATLARSVEQLTRDQAALKKHLDESLDGGSPAPEDGSQTGHRYALLEELPAARLAQGRPDQAAIWETDLGGETRKAIYLQPPAELVFQIPTGAPGRFAAAIAIHPDAWAKPGAGACEFQVRIGSRLAFGVAIDPTRLPSDRRWHEIRLDVPETTGGNHQISLQTRAIGQGADFRWALWRNPVFTWLSPATPSQNA